MTTPTCRTYKIGAESRGYKVTNSNGYPYKVINAYAPLVGKDLTLNSPTFDAPEIIPMHEDEPSAAFSWLPYYVVDDEDGTFSIISKASPYAAWDISAQVPRTGTQYYVAKTGNDSTGDGLSWGTAYLTIGKATTTIGSTPNCVINVGAGKYDLWGGVIPQAINVSLIGKSGDTVIMDSFVTGDAWALTSGKTYTYESGSFVTAAVVTFVLDYKNLDANGDPTYYTKVASIDAVEATAGTWYPDTASSPKKMYVHTLDDDSPDTDIRPQYGGDSILAVTTNDVNIYIENIRAYAKNASIASNGADNTGKVYLNNCRVMFGVKFLNYGYTLFAKDCQFAHNYGSNEDLVDGELGTGSNVPKFAFIDCEGWGSGVTGNSASNVITSHAAGAFVDLNGEYHDTNGPPVALIASGYFWGLGTYSHDNLNAATNYYSFQFGLAGTWLDTCESANSTKDIYADPATVYVRDCTLPATSDATLVDY